MMENGLIRIVLEVCVLLPRISEFSTEIRRGTCFRKISGLPGYSPLFHSSTGQNGDKKNDRRQPAIDERRFK